MPLTPQQAEEFWACADCDGNGKMTIKELKVAMTTKYNANMSDADIAKIFCGIDKSGDSVITKDEFLEEMVNKVSRSEGLCKLFKELDTSGDGKLTKDELSKLFSQYYKEKDPEEALQDFLKNADKSNDDVITYEEFEAFFR